jgi:exocyst complex component 3
VLQSLTDLENSRDDLLYELHKLPNQAPADKIMLKAYFEDVEVLSQLLEKQLRLVMSRTLNTVRKEPTVIVTALRIIEREEKADSFALQVWWTDVLLICCFHLLAVLCSVTH